MASVYMDDIIVWGSTIEQHDERLEKAVNKLVQIGLRLNKDKCKCYLIPSARAYVPPRRSGDVTRCKPRS